MKAKLEDIPSEKGTSSFYAYRFQVPFFEFKWHYHPEFELTYIVKGSGYRIVGDSYEYFSAGDLVLLGSNLPHTWSGILEDDVYSEAVVIQFSKEFISSFLELKESVLIKNMLETSVRGISFETNEVIVSKIIGLTESSGVDRILKLITILDDLSKQQATFIASNTFHNVVSKKNEMRINKVCQFIQSNFNNKISLSEVANLIYLTESNFCKFFKKATGKTYSDYLNEIRINEACRLLAQSEKTISQISFECGFETLSYFNRVFLNKKGMTPSVFKKEKLI
ncbi:AraC family transcriptional regulator [Flavobacterium sp.]|uniref:AraC family transcriptional regulator n=1 Tax=Flavobacterium sp. TaxID=239 RepID=UPI002629E7E1|nr:AraC family transcriptional regulator [Flavobacterium sp.]